MDFLLHVTIMACLSLFPILGFSVVFGKGKILHFGQIALSLAAVYTLWVLVVQYHFSYIPALLLSFAAVTIVAIIFAWLSFRLEPDGFGVMSIAVHLSLLAVVLNWQGVTRGALGIPRIPRGFLPASLEGYALFVVVAAAIWVIFIWLLDRGRFGRALNALSQHEWHAQSLGIERRRIHTFAFIIAGIGALFSAALYPPYLYLLSPSDYAFPWMIFFVMVVVAGGSGRMWGVVLATFFLSFLKEGLRFIDLPPDVLGPVRLMLFGIILFAAVWWRRDTLFPQERRV